MNQKNNWIKLQEAPQVGLESVTSHYFSLVNQNEDHDNLDLLV